MAEGKTDEEFRQLSLLESKFWEASLASMLTQIDKVSRDKG